MKCDKCGHEDGYTNGDMLATLASEASAQGMSLADWTSGCRTIFRLAELARKAKVVDRGRAIAQALSSLLDPEGKEPTPTE